MIAKVHSADYERALEQRNLAVSSQAGQSLMRRQETQDILALLRVLADSSDTLAFGALMRGPLVGLTDQELLDITAGLLEKNGRPNFIGKLQEEADSQIETVGAELRGNMSWMKGK